MRLTLLVAALAVAHLCAFAQAQIPAPSGLPSPADLTKPGCFGDLACGKTNVKVSAVIEPRYINGETVNVFACECIGGRKIVVTDAGKVVLDLAGQPSLAPKPAVTTAPPPTNLGAGWSSLEDYKAFVANVTSQFNGTQIFPSCKDIDYDLLWQQGSKTSCYKTLVLGTVCDKTCQATMKALGFGCWEEVFVKEEKLDPTKQNSTPQVQYYQCTKGIPYTTLAEFNLANAPSKAPSRAPKPAPPSSAQTTQKVLACAATVLAAGLFL